MRAIDTRRGLHGSRHCHGRRHPSPCAIPAAPAAGGLPRARAVTRCIAFRGCRAAAGEVVREGDTRSGDAWRAEWTNWWWAAANAEAVEVSRVCEQGPVCTSRMRLEGQTHCPYQHHVNTRGQYV
jgi:hypothetical protein